MYATGHRGRNAMSDNSQRSIQDIVAEKAVDGRITCPVLRKAAEDTGVSYKEAGAAAIVYKSLFAAANDADITIINCALGCF